MKIKKYTNGFWTEGDYEKEYSTATDTYTTLPATFQTSSADVENYQVYGETVKNLWGFTTQPLSGTGYLYNGSINLPAGAYTLRADIISGNTNMSCAVVDNRGTTVINTTIFNHSSITFTSNYDMTQLRFFVSGTVNELYLTLVPGSTAPARYVPYGTPDGVGEETENEFPFAEAGTYAFGSGSVVSDGRGKFTISVIAGGEVIESLLIPISQPYAIPSSKAAGGEYTFYLGSETIASEIKIIFYDENRNKITNWEWQYSSSWRKSSTYMSSIGSTIAYIGFAAQNITISNMPTTPMFSKNDNLATYIPFGYKIPILNTSGVTENLWDENYIDISDNIHYRSIQVGSGTFTLSSTVIRYQDMGNLWACLFFLPGNVSSGSSTNNNGVWDERPQTVEAIDGYVTIGYRLYSDSGISPANYDTMLNAGSTALPYQPHRHESNYDLFIGDSKLYADEYLDFMEQKIYKTPNVFNNTVENWSASSPVIVVDNGDGSFTLSKVSGSGVYPAIKIGDNLEINETYKLSFQISGLTQTMLDSMIYVGLRRTTNNSFITGGLKTITGDGVYTTVFLKPTENSIAFSLLLANNASVTFNNVVISDISINEVTPTDPPAPFPTLATYIGENNISVDTTVQPEKVSVEYKGWKGVGDVEKYQNGEWVSS